MFKSMDIGIDLGTANILVYVRGKGVVLKEPSVVAIDKVRNKVLAVGEAAREMLGRSPGTIVAIRPLKEGVIANYTVTQKLLSYVIEKVAGKSLFFKPRVMTCVPIGITSVEKRAGKEPVLLFSSDLTASVTPEARRLRDFTKIELQAGETKTVSFSLKAEDLAFVGHDLEWTLEPGEFRLAIGNQSLMLNCVE